MSVILIFLNLISKLIYYLDVEAAMNLATIWMLLKFWNWLNIFYCDFKLRRDHRKNFLWATRLWVGRRKKPILGYVPKNAEKKKYSCI